MLLKSEKIELVQTCFFSLFAALLISMYINKTNKDTIIDFINVIWCMIEISFLR